MRQRFLTVVLALALTGCSIFGGDEDPSEPPAELIDFDSTVKVKRQWSSGLGGEGENKRLGLSPATDGSRVYAGGHGGKVLAIDSTSGKRVFEANTKLPLSAGPGVGSDLLVFGTSDGDLLALSSADGSERWRVNVGSEVLARPAIANGVVVVRSVDGRLRGLSEVDGGELWLVEQSVPRLSLRGNAPAVVAGVNAIAGFDNGRLGAYDITTGEPVWEIAVSASKGRTELERLVDISSGVSIVGDDAYAVGYQGRAVSVALDTGLVLWQRELSSYAGLAADWNNVYVTDENSEVIALDRGSGRPLWTNNTMRRRDLTAPTAFSNSVVVGDFEGYIHWLSAENGALQARVKVGNGRVSGAPVAVGELLCAQTDTGELTAFAIEVERKRRR